MMLRRILIFARWLTVLIGVLMLIDVLTVTLAWAGSGAGTGIFSYRFHARLQLDHDVKNDRTIVGSVSVEGRTEPQFKVWGHVSPRYHQVQIEWQLFGDPGSEGQVVIDLREMQIERDGHTVPLTANSIGNLLGVPNPGENDDAVSPALIQFFESARDGTLPVPSHHGRGLSEPLPGKMRHFADGPAIRPLGLLWVVAWSISGLSRLFTRQRIYVGETKQA